jgi:hypothetical protein
LLIDNDPERVAAAVNLGYPGVVMAHEQRPDGRRPDAGLPLITTPVAWHRSFIGTR